MERREAISSSIEELIESMLQSLINKHLIGNTYLTQSKILCTEKKETTSMLADRPSLAHAENLTWSIMVILNYRNCEKILINSL